MTGAVVHWGASPADIARAVNDTRGAVAIKMTRIAIVEGDGIGHEVIPVAKDVLELLHPGVRIFRC